MSESSRNESRGQRGGNNRGGYKGNGSSKGGYKRNDRDGKKFSDRGDRKFGDKKFGDKKRGERSYGDRDRKFGDRNDRRDDRRGGERRFNDRDGKKFEGRGGRKFDDRKGGFKRDDRRDNRRDGERSYGDRDRKFNNERGERRFNDRDNRGGRRYNNENRPAGGHQRGGQKHRDERFANTGSKDGYRPSKGQGPEFDTDVTGKELDGYVQRQLRALEIQNAEVVAKNLVMASRYLELDPQFALEHATAAVKRAGRIAAVREAAGITAYVAEDYEMALRELRTHRRISGSNEHYAIQMDCERALGRIEKALTMAEESRELDLDAATRVEVALVVSGIKHDQGDLKGAIAALEIPELNAKRGYDYSPRLFEAYADLLDEDGRRKEAARWMRLAVITEAALGQGEFAEPEIFDIFGEAELFEDEEQSIDLEGAEKVVEPGLEEDDDEDSEEENEAEAPAQHEITEESSLDDDIELEADVQEVLNYTAEDAEEDRLNIVEETEKDA